MRIEHYADWHFRIYIFLLNILSAMTDSNRISLYGLILYDLAPFYIITPGRLSALRRLMISNHNIQSYSILYQEYEVILERLQTFKEPGNVLLTC